MRFAFLITSPCYFYSKSEQQREESGKAAFSGQQGQGTAPRLAHPGPRFHPQGDTELTQVPASVHKRQWKILIQQIMMVQKDLPATTQSPLWKQNVITSRSASRSEAADLFGVRQTWAPVQLCVISEKSLNLSGNKLVIGRTFSVLCGDD